MGRRCPDCGSEDIQALLHGKVVDELLFSGIPNFARKSGAEFQCRRCGYTFGR